MKHSHENFFLVKYSRFLPRTLNLYRHWYFCRFRLFSPRLTLKVSVLIFSSFFSLPRAFFLQCPQSQYWKWLNMPLRRTRSSLWICLHRSLASSSRDPWWKSCLMLTSSLEMRRWVVWMNERTNKWTNGLEPGVVVHTFHPKIHEAKVGTSCL